MANKLTTIPIKLAVNCARLESIRKITRRTAIVFSPPINPSLRTPLDSSLRRSKGTIRSICFCGEKS